MDIAWTSDSGGNFTSNVKLDGLIIKVVTDPGASAPTDNYDVTLVDEFGLDLLAGQGANRDTTNSEMFCPGIVVTDGTNTSVMPMSHKGTATLTIANAGDTKNGTVSIYSKFF